MSRTIEALKLIESKKPYSFRHFAKLFWPNSDMHTNYHNCGNGATRGAGAFLCAGSFLAKLRKKGLITVYHSWDFDKRNLDLVATLTDKGRNLLEKGE